MKTLDVTFRLTPEQFTTMLVDNLEYTKHLVEVHATQAAQFPQRTPTGKSAPRDFGRQTGPLSTISVRKQLNGSGSNTKLLAMQVATKLAALTKKPFTRAHLTKELQQAFEAHGFAVSGASATISDLIRSGHLKVEEQIKPR